MTQEEIIRNCENLLDGKQQDPLYQMMFMMMNMLMEMEANKITGSEKGEHNSNRINIFKNMMATFVIIEYIICYTI